MSYGHKDKYLEVIDMTSQNDSNAKDTIDTFIDQDNTEDNMVDGIIVFREKRSISKFLLFCNILNWSKGT